VASTVRASRPVKTDVQNAGGLYEDSEVVVDGNLVTSRIPGDLPAFCREIVRLLEAEPVPG
jgi:protease I